MIENILTQIFSYQNKGVQKNPSEILFLSKLKSSKHPDKSSAQSNLNLTFDLLKVAVRELSPKK